MFAEDLLVTRHVLKTSSSVGRWDTTGNVFDLFSNALTELAKVTGPVIDVVLPSFLPYAYSPSLCLTNVSLPCQRNVRCDRSI